MKVLIAYNLEDDYVEKMRKTFPDVEFSRVVEPGNMKDAIVDADIVLGGRFNAELFLQAKKLKWIQTSSAGVERFLFPELVESKVILTDASGVHAKPIAEQVIGFMLSFTRKLNIFLRLQLQKKWGRMTGDELSGKVLGVIGLGSVGSEIARKAKVFDMTVIATKKTLTAKPTYVDELLPSTELESLLKRSDFLILSTPLTPETYHMIDEKKLKIMKKGAILINIGRGKLIDENALIKALKEHWIAGAGLDVFETEPLPVDSELWNLENVIITPHTAGSTPHYSERVCQLFMENLKRFREGSPLINVVDKKAGY